MAARLRQGAVPYRWIGEALIMTAPSAIRGRVFRFREHRTADPIGSALRARFRDAIAPSARTVFGRAERKEGDIGYVAPWGLLVHARESELLADVPRVKRKGGAGC